MRDRRPPLASFEPEVPDGLVARRDAIRRGASVGGRAAAALATGSVPVLLAALARDSIAQAPTTIRGVLEFAYILENLEYEFYNAVLSAPAFAVVRGTLTQVETATLAQIRRHELAHVNLLRSTIGQLGGTPATLTAANFDFTAGNGTGAGPLAAATSDKAVLLATAQSLEDTGVRAYKGQVAKLMGNQDVLTGRRRGGDRGHLQRGAEHHARGDQLRRGRRELRRRGGGDGGVRRADGVRAGADGRQPVHRRRSVSAAARERPFIPS
jgi:Ferritin-like domain